jgi:hypothetical protein
MASAKIASMQKELEAARNSAASLSDEMAVADRELEAALASTKADAEISKIEKKRDDAFRQQKRNDARIRHLVKSIDETAQIELNAAYSAGCAGYSIGLNQYQRLLSDDLVEAAATISGAILLARTLGMAKTNLQGLAKFVTKEERVPLRSPPIDDYNLAMGLNSLAMVLQAHDIARPMPTEFAGFGHVDMGLVTELRKILADINAPPADAAMAANEPAPEHSVAMA